MGMGGQNGQGCDSPDLGCGQKEPAVDGLSKPCQALPDPPWRQGTSVPSRRAGHPNPIPLLRGLDTKYMAVNTIDKTLNKYVVLGCFKFCEAKNRTAYVWEDHLELF